LKTALDGDTAETSRRISFSADRVANWVANSCRRISLKNIPFIFRAKYCVVYKTQTRNSSWRGLIAFFVVVERLRVAADRYSVPPGDARHNATMPYCLLTRDWTLMTLQIIKCYAPFDFPAKRRFFCVQIIRFTVKNV